LLFLKLHIPKKPEYGNNMSPAPRKEGTPHFAKWWMYERERQAQLRKLWRKIK